MNAVTMNMRFEPVPKETDSVTNRSSAVPSKTDSSQENDVKLTVVMSDPKAATAEPTDPSQLHAKSA